MIDITKERYHNADKTTFLQQIEKGTLRLFNDTFVYLCAYAADHDLDQPQKGELLNYMMRNGAEKIDGETYFKK